MISVVGLLIVFAAVVGSGVMTAELATVREQLDMLEQRTEFNQRLLEGRSPDEYPAATEE